jgi:(R,R)-butanediol dehydrogenase/meso-butanediol dehydrogenase/diacetyl reductase
LETMKSLVSDSGAVAYGDREHPPLSPGEVRLAVIGCGICGSDLHWYRQGHIPPVCPGHELVGEIRSAVPAGCDLRTGQRVTVEAVRSCGVCEFCRSGARQLCKKLGLVGIDQPGGFAEFVDVLPSQLHGVPDSIASDVATFAEPVAVAVHALRLAPPPAGKRALVLGGGSLGLLTAFCLLRAGAACVDLTAKRPHQREAASNLGVASVIDPGGSEFNSYDLVYETVGGDGETLNEPLMSVKPGGTVVMLGVFEQAPAFPALLLLSKEIRMVGAMCYGSSTEGADFVMAHQILHEAGSDLKNVLLTHSYPLREIATAFATAARKDSGSIKVQIQI